MLMLWRRAPRQQWSLLLLMLWRRDQRHRRNQPRLRRGVDSELKE